MPKKTKFKEKIKETMAIEKLSLTIIRASPTKEKERREKGRK